MAHIERLVASVALSLGVVGVLVGCTSPTEDVPTSSEAAVVETPTEETTCTLGWGEMPRAYDGIEGSYVRAGVIPAGAMKTLELNALQPIGSGPISEAASTRTFACSPSCATENARAELVPVNGAINPMILFSTNGFGRPDADLRDVFNVLGVKRSPDGKVAGLCLYRVVGPIGTGSEQPFLMRRL